MKPSKYNLNCLTFGIYSLIFILNFAIKFIYIENRDVALDEPFSIYYGQMDLNSIVKMLYNENNPPFHFFILHFFIKIFGTGALAVRLPSLIFSAFTAVVIFKIGNKFFNQITGIGASLIFTFSTMHIFFSHEARVYPLFVLLTACSLYIFMLIIESPTKPKYFIWLFFCNTLLIYSHYFGFFVLFTEVFSLLVIQNRKAIWKRLFWMMTLVAATYIPIILIFIHRLGVSTEKGTWVAVPEITELYGNLNRFLNNRYNTAVLIIIFLFAFLIMLRRKTINTKINELKKNIYFKICLIWFAVPYLIMFFVSFKYPMFIDRYILFTSVPFFISIAIAINHFFEIKYSILAFLFLILSQIFTMKLNPDNNRRLKEVVMIAKALETRNSTTIIAPDYAFMGFSYYYNIDYFKQAPNTIKLLNQSNIFPLSNTKAANEILKARKNKAYPCIYVQAGSEFADPENEILKSIQNQYKKQKTFYVFEIYRIHYFTN